MTLPATSVLTDRVRRFLEEPRYAVVATTDDDGAPRQAVVWFLVDDDTIVINSLDGRRWPTNLRRNPRVAIAITEPNRESWVGLTGTVEVVDDQAQAQADIAAMARRYHASNPAAAEAVIANRFTKQRRVSFRLRPTAVHDHIED
jgi:PPOX class probable F420-dependent enzyme